MKIAILGGGHGGYAAAADLSGAILGRDLRRSERTLEAFGLAAPDQLRERLHDSGDGDA
ncbi:MAG: hypothetical protein AB7G13_21855 [Lautropia sp.]